MSAYTRGPNVSQYIANLNSISPRNAEAGPQRENGNLEDDLLYFTQAELFDFDPGNNEGQHQDFIDGHQTGADASSAQGMDYNGVFDNYIDSPSSLHLNTNFSATGNFDPQLFQSPQSATFPAQQRHQTSQSHHQQQQEQEEEQPSPATANSQAAGNKRAHSATSPTGSVEEVARVAAEEDKRRRNTAASARFRVKKKQREAALEKTAKEMTDKVSQLEKRVSELEMENKWLRGLVVEKGMNVKSEDADTKTEEEKNVDERIPNERTKRGVGTKAEAA